MKVIQIMGTTTIFIIILLIFIRMALPFEFFFTKSYLSTNILLQVDNFFRRTSVFSGSIFLIDVICFSWIGGIIYNIFKLATSYYHLKKSIAHMKNENTESVKIILDRIKMQGIKIPSNLKIVRSRITQIPMIFGFFQPVIAIPANKFSEEELYYILCHELFHYHRHDLWYKMFLEIICSIYWWNPIIVIGLRRTCINILEYNTDLSVANILCENEKVSYLECILNASHKNKRKSDSVFQLNLTSYHNKNYQKNLLRRFKLVLDYNKNEISPLVKVISIVGATSIFLFSFIFVIKPYYVMPIEEYENIFVIDTDSAYIVQHDENFYILYMKDGTEIATMSNIDDSFTNLRVHQLQKGDMYK